MDSIGKAGAVALFVARVQPIRPEFRLERENAAAIAGICRHLDGLPLAIELAAARVRVLHPASLLARLDQRLPLLTRGPQDECERHQTVCDAIAWSYDLLDEEEKRLFRWLSVFVGGCTLQAAEIVCSGNDRRTSILENAESLIDKHLVRLEAASGTDRLDMLETIREYARERLIESGEAQLATERHASYYLSIVEEAAPNLMRVVNSTWFRRVEAESGNLAAALRWCTAAPGRLEMEMRLASALIWFWCIRGYVSQGRAWLETALERSSSPIMQNLDKYAALRVKCLYSAGALAYTRGESERARAHLKESLMLSGKAGDRLLVAQTRHLLGLALLGQGNAQAARNEYETSLPLIREAGDKWSEVDRFSI